MDEKVCSDCGEDCQAVEETFDYAGTHCTGGQRGTHRTGHYVSHCCLAGIVTRDEYNEAAWDHSQSILWWHHDGKFAEND